MGTSSVLFRCRGASSTYILSIINSVYKDVYKGMYKGRAGDAIVRVAVTCLRGGRKA